MKASPREQKSITLLIRLHGEFLFTPPNLEWALLVLAFVIRGFFKTSYIKGSFLKYAAEGCIL